MPRTSLLLIFILLVLTAAVIATGAYFWGEEFVEPVDLPPAREEESVPLPEAVEEVDMEVLAENLEIPWEIVFLPEGDILATQRTGSIIRVDNNGRVFDVDGVEHVGEGGLLGMAPHPDFSANNWLYIYMTTRVEGGLQNRVVRYRYADNNLSDGEIIIDNIPGAQFHDGGRIAFSPDNYLFVTTGDANEPALSQDRQSLAGKILRVYDDGSIPDDNPFENAVYSYGHRNPQGLAWDKDGRLWSTEHGPRGHDELNLIEIGRNYGWPNIQGDQTEEGMEAPAIHSGMDTWAPGGAAYVDGSIFFGGLRGSAIYEARLDGDTVSSLETHFKGEFGRIRAVVLGSDGHIYIATSNTDGRGIAREGDDKIIRFNLRVFD